MSRIYTVAVIGCGIGRSHVLEGYVTNTDRFRVLALCDLNPERMAAVGDEFGVERRTTSFDEVLALPRAPGDVEARGHCPDHRK